MTAEYRSIRPGDNAIIVDIVDYKGREFDTDFHVGRDPAHGPGWYVFGRCSIDGVIKVVARPNVKLRRHPHYNCKVRRGWQTKTMAQAVANSLTLEFTKEKINEAHF